LSRRLKVDKELDERTSGDSACEEQLISSSQLCVHGKRVRKLQEEKGLTVDCMLIETSATELQVCRGLVLVVRRCNLIQFVFCISHDDVHVAILEWHSDTSSFLDPFLFYSSSPPSTRTVAHTQTRICTNCTSGPWESGSTCSKCSSEQKAQFLEQNFKATVITLLKQFGTV